MVFGILSGGKQIKKKTNKGRWFLITSKAGFEGPASDWKHQIKKVYTLKHLRLDYKTGGKVLFF